MSSVQTKTFGPETWAKGHRGQLRPHATDRPHLKDVRFTRSGLVVPRPLWENEHTTVAGDADDVFRSVRYGTGGFASQFGVFVGDISSGAGSFYVYDMGVTPTYPSAAGAVCPDDRDFKTVWVDDLVCLMGDAVNDFSGSAAAPTFVITGSSAVAAIQARFGTGTFICKGSMLHGGRAFYWGPDAGVIPFDQVNRIYFSDYLEYDTFSSASQFFDVDGSVEGCISLGPNLLIWTADGRWTMMQGIGDPATATFTTLGQAPIPARGAFPIVLDTVALFMASDDRGICSINAGGTVDDQTLRHLAFTEEASAYADTVGTGHAAANSLLNTAMILDEEGTGILYLQNGVWAAEEWADVSGATWNADMEPSGTKDGLFIRVGSNWEFHYRDQVATAPPRSDDGTYSEFVETPSSIGTELFLPRITDPTKQIRAKRIVVDGLAWNDPTYYAAPDLTINVYDGTDTTTEALMHPTGLFTNLDAADAQPFRAVFTVPDTHVHSSFVDVQLSGIISVGVERVTVEYEVSNMVFP